MIKIMEVLQWQYLNLVGEHVEDKAGYNEDLKVIYSSTGTEKKARIKADLAWKFIEVASAIQF